MQNEKLGDIINLAGNVGLIIGLILVGVQIYQNNELTKMQMVHQDMMANEERHRMMVGENPAQIWAKAIADPTSLSHEEHVVIDNIFKTHLTHLQKLVRLQELGFELIEPRESQYISGMAYYLSSTYGQAWWAENSDLIAPVVSEAISRALRKYPDNYLNREIEDINAALAQPQSANP